MSQEGLVERAFRLALVERTFRFASRWDDLVELAFRPASRPQKRIEGLQPRNVPPAEAGSRFSEVPRRGAKAPLYPEHQCGDAALKGGSTRRVLQ